MPIKKRETHIMKSIAYARIVWGHLLSSPNKLAREAICI